MKVAAKGGRKGGRRGGRRRGREEGRGKRGEKEAQKKGKKKEEDRDRGGRSERRPQEGSPISRQLRPASRAPCIVDMVRGWKKGGGVKSEQEEDMI